jgi:hypothetical protein
MAPGTRVTFFAKPALIPLFEPTSGICKLCYLSYLLFKKFVFVGFAVLLLE